jgi:hypothetical protein
MMMATLEDLRTLAALVGIEKHWHTDDGKDTLSVERAAYWRQVLTRAHIPQLVLLRQLEGVYPEGHEHFRSITRDLLNKRALLLIALDHAVSHDQPIQWPDMIHD